ncbi:chromosome segregation protein [Carpediemonas membranifera]|uniref:Chromosome segregation protein n=1 Tax=Carpediemonas membranifera TaxID=201153 RepID=A0A8J6B0K4_9EUKA|nr:chromosome segregation protein [Carpediemonas membranifera]|eukprot:KAG9392958.1 chromosome segregation protein [Carpediemonas membranifera]
MKSSRLRISHEAAEGSFPRPPATAPIRTHKFHRSNTAETFHARPIHFPPATPTHRTPVPEMKRSIRELSRPSTTQAARPSRTLPPASVLRVDRLKEYVPHRGVYKSSTYDSTAAAVFKGSSWPSVNFSGARQPRFKSTLLEVEAELRTALATDPGRAVDHYRKAARTLVGTNPMGYGAILTEALDCIDEELKEQHSIPVAEYAGLVEDHERLQVELESMRQAHAALEADLVESRRVIAQKDAEIAQARQETASVQETLQQLVGGNPEFVEQFIREQMVDYESQLSP